jgi:hypothetical protein
MKYSNIIMGQILCPCVYVLMFSLMFGLLLVPTFSYSQPQSNAHFENFVSKAGKFSIDYPGSWTVKEKNRFDEPNTVNVSIFNAEEEFSLPRWDISYLGPIGSNTSLAEIVNYFFNDRPQRGDPSLHPTIRVIEPINLTKYVIDGESAGSYIYGIRYNTSDLKVGEQTVILKVGEQTVITIHNNTAYTLVFNSLADEFDSPVTTQIREHMINSVRWIP